MAQGSQGSPIGTPETSAARAEAPDVTALLLAWQNGDASAADALFPAVYSGLHDIAARAMRRETPGHTMQTTGLVHESYLRLVDQKGVQWQNRAHFFAVAAQMIRRILVDHARTHNAEKRGGGACKLALDEAIAFALQEQGAPA